VENSLPEPLAITQKVTLVFDELNIPYFIGGSFASAFYGILRATMDIDLIADIKIDHIPLLVDHLQNEFYIDSSMIQDAITHQSSFNLIHLATMFKVDVFILKDREFEQQQFTHRQKYPIGEKNPDYFFFTSPEDIILAKLGWFKAGGEVSEKQWNDILGVLQVQSGHLNEQYLLQWAKKLDLFDLYQRAVNQAKLS